MGVDVLEYFVERGDVMRRYLYAVIIIVCICFLHITGVVVVVVDGGEKGKRKRPARKLNSPILSTASPRLIPLHALDCSTL